MDVNVFIFDLFGVVIAFDNDIVYSRLARHCGNPVEAFGRLNGLMASHDVITGALTLPQIHRQLVETQGLTLDFSEFETAWLEPYSQAMPGMASLLGKLSEHYRLVLLSNVDRYYFDVVRAMHAELEHFEWLLPSCDLALAKPDPRIFRHVCQLSGALPSRCYFIDDTLVNVEAAKTLGFRTHWFRGVEELVKELVSAKTRGL